MRYLPKPLASPFFVSLGCIIIRLKHLIVFMDNPLHFTQPPPSISYWSYTFFVFKSRSPSSAMLDSPPMSRFLRIVPYTICSSVLNRTLLTFPNIFFATQHSYAFTNSKQQPIFGVLYCLCKRKLKKNIWG